MRIVFRIEAEVDDNTPTGILDTLATSLRAHVKHTVICAVDRAFVAASWKRQDVLERRLENLERW